VNASHTRCQTLGPELISVVPLLSARPAVIFPAAEHHHPLAGIKLECLVTEAHRCEQLAQGWYVAFALSGI